MTPIVALIATALLALHNGARVAHHEPRLRYDRALGRAAVRKAHDVARCGFSHDACGHRWTFYLPRRLELGENLAYGYTTVRGVFSAWLRSPEHRANVLRRGFARIGYARLGLVWVVEFSS